MEHTYIVQYRQELELWQDDESFSTLDRAMEYAKCEALESCLHEHRVVRAELKPLVIFRPLGEADQR
jgi:hypothetical protein